MSVSNDTKVNRVNHNVLELEAERLNVLLYNAIVCLEEYGCDKAQLESDIGITEKEYAAIMNFNAFSLEEASLTLDEKISAAQNLQFKNEDSHTNSFDIVNDYRKQVSQPLVDAFLASVNASAIDNVSLEKLKEERQTVLTKLESSCENAADYGIYLELLDTAISDAELKNNSRNNENER